MSNDPPIHLAGYQICDHSPHSDPSVTIPVWITQSSLDGIQTLIKFCEGLEAGGKGRVPGSFELVMFYRTLRDCIGKAEQAHVEAKRADMTDIVYTYDDWAKNYQDVMATPGFRAPTSREFSNWNNPADGRTPVGVIDKTIIFANDRPLAERL